MEANSQALADVDNLSYEAARDELIRVVQQLETGGVTLEESLTLWERGEALAKRCEHWLIGAKARLEQARLQTTAADEVAATDDNLVESTGL